MAKIIIRIEDVMAGHCPSAMTWELDVRSPGTDPKFWADGVQRAVQQAADIVIEQLERSVEMRSMGRPPVKAKRNLESPRGKGETP